MLLNKPKSSLTNGEWVGHYISNFGSHFDLDFKKSEMKHSKI